MTKLWRSQEKFDCSDSNNDGEQRFVFVTFPTGSDLEPHLSFSKNMLIILYVLFELCIRKLARPPTDCTVVLPKELTQDQESWKNPNSSITLAFFEVFGVKDGVCQDEGARICMCAG